MKKVRVLVMSILVTISLSMIGIPSVQAMAAEGSGVGLTQYQINDKIEKNNYKIKDIERAAFNNLKEREKYYNDNLSKNIKFLKDNSSRFSYIKDLAEKSDEFNEYVRCLNLSTLYHKSYDLICPGYYIYIKDTTKLDKLKDVIGLDLAGLSKKDSETNSLSWSLYTKMKVKVLGEKASYNSDEIKYLNALTLVEDWNKDNIYDYLDGLYKDVLVTLKEENEKLENGDLTKSTETKKGWQKDNNGKWNFLNENGEKFKGWLQDSRTWYLMSKDGEMLTDWQKYSQTWYKLSESGAMLTGWQKDGNEWYLLGENGAMKTGWVNIKGTWYYLNENGTMATGWKKVRNDWYYLNKNGSMLSSTIVDGCRLDSNGIWIK